MGVIQRLPTDVVNRIAAGEVVVRPANAVKELIENCLDANATEIIVSLKKGGLQLLQVQDNGKGIGKDDMEIVCERFTTSKLRQFEDLMNMSTFGFRGEALASISYVSKGVSVINHKATGLAVLKQNSLNIGVQQNNGKMLSLKPSAGLNGTCVTAEDLFYNCSSRDVSFTLRRGTGIGDFRSKGNNDRAGTIASLLGPECAEDLMCLSCSSTGLQYSVDGCLAKPKSAVTARSVAAKKNRQRSFFLFINNRAVSSAALKHAVDTIFADRDIVCPFVFLSLTMDPRRVDVNVHPTKDAVLFLEEEAIISHLTTELGRLLDPLFSKDLAPSSLSQSKLKDNDEVFRMLTNTQAERIPSSTQSFLSDPSKTRGTPEAAKRRDHNLVRTDEKERRLDSFLQPVALCSQDAGGSQNNGDIRMVAIEGSQGDGFDCSTNHLSSGVSRRDFNLTSVENLRKRVATGASQSLRPFFKSQSFVGCVDPEKVLVQHGTGLYLIDFAMISKEMLYQNVLFSFGNLGSCRLEAEDEISIEELYVIGCQSLELEHTGNATECLMEHLTMLDDYFSLRFTWIESHSEQGPARVMVLSGVPALFPDFVPQMEGLPALIVHLVDYVDWTQEEACFDGISRALAEFYTVKPQFTKGDYLSGLHQNRKWRQTIETILLPSIQSRLIPLERFKEKKSVRRLADLHDMYKVFERC